MKMRLAVSVSMAILSVISGCADPSSTTPINKENDTIYSGPNFNDHIRSTSARTPEEERAGFLLPEGFDIQLYASEPDIGKPINFNFDAKGRMWVTQSFEYPFPAKTGEGKDRLTILEDTNHDGRADVFTHIADTLNIPIGVFPLQDNAIVYSIPNLLSLPIDGLTKRKSQKLFGPFEHKDTHGMVNNLTRGFDGWIYACHGYTNHSTISAPGGPPIELISGSTFRFSEDGKKAERQTTGRINPFGLAFDELGYLYSTDCHTSPLYQLISGGDYPQSGKDEGIGFAPDMKPFDNEATALAGLAYYADTCFPTAFQRNLFIGDAVASRVYRNSFTFNGSTPIGKKEPDFIKSSDPWFRPVAVQMGPDGALYIADFYNSIIGHYEVPLNHPKRDKIRGRIWRVTYKGRTHKKIDFTRETVDALTAALSGTNLATRMQAADELVRRGPKAAESTLLAAMKSDSATVTSHGIWILQRWGRLTDSILNACIHSDEVAIRVHTFRAMKEILPVRRAFQELTIQGLNDKNAHVRRAAVEMVSSFPTVSSVRELTKILNNHSAADTHLEYTARLTLRNLLRDNKLLGKVMKESWTAEESSWLAGVMIGVEGAMSGSFTLNYLRNKNVEPKAVGRFLRHSVRWVPANLMDSVVALGRARAMADPKSESKVYAELLKGFEERGLSGSDGFRLWGKDITLRTLEANARLKNGASPDWQALYFAVATAGKYKMVGTYPLLSNIFADTSVPVDGRLLVLRNMFVLSPDSIAVIAKRILSDPAATTEYKRQTVTVMADFPSNGLSDVVAAIPDPAPDLQWWVTMVLAGSPYGQEILLAKAKAGKVPLEILTEPMIAERISLRQSPRLRTEFATLTSSVIDGRKLKEKVIGDRIANYTALQSKPSAADGRIIFQKNCSPCHSIKGEGGSIGPQLDEVGKWGVTSLVEKILDPNRNVSENFINYTITKKDGQVVSGLYRRTEGAVEVFVNLAGKEFTVASADIAQKTKAKYTLMPDQFKNIIPEKDFYLLLTYLLSQQSE